MKKKLDGRYPARSGICKFLLKMKLLAIFLMVAFTATSSESYSQGTKFNFRLNNVTVKDVIQEIEERSEFVFLYSEEDVDLSRKVTVRVKDETVESILDQVFKGTANDWKVYDRQIVLVNREEESPAPAPRVPETISQPERKSISGIVKDNLGIGLPGVSIIIKGTMTGTVTDVNGEFTLQAAVGEVLVFSFVGKTPVEVAVGQRNIIDVELFDDATEIEEVQVVAFGVQKKESVIASIETVRPGDLKQPASNLTAALAGKIPGIISYQSTGEPGNDNAQFFVRGVTTFGYKTNPLILIDGFEASSSDLARLEPDDIESFSILKDASATVLYGARGANGIIIVVTKAGREGPTKVNVRLESHVATPTQMNKLLDGVDYMRLYNEARVSRNPLLGTFYSEQKIQSTIDGINPMIYPNIDWYDELFKSSTINKKANFNISGGGRVATYYVAGGLENETGLLKVDSRNNFNNNIDINRVLLRNNVVFRLTPTTNLDTRLQGRFER